MMAYNRLLNESPSGYFSFERVDSTLDSSDTKINTSCSWNSGTSSALSNYEKQTTQSVPSPVSSIDSTYGSWNVPKSRSPLPDLWTCDLEFLYSLISPISTPTNKSIRSSTTECMLDINNNGDHSYPCFCSPCVQRGNISSCPYQFIFLTIPSFSFCRIPERLRRNS